MLNYINMKVDLKNRSIIRIILQELTAYKINTFLSVFASNEKGKLNDIIPLEHNYKCVRT